MTDNATILQNRLKERLGSLFSHYPAIAAVYLFGSAATGQQQAHSDLDLAIVPRSDTLRPQKLDILADLAHAGFDNIDLLILDTSDLVLNYEAVQHNRIVYRTNDFEPKNFLLQHGAKIS